MNPNGRPPRNLAERFWEKVELSADGCWLWQGGRFPNGYGQFRVGTRKQSAHRVAWVLSWGHIPQGMLVCHRCDTPLCVCPDHLFLGTPQDNFQDCIAKGRLPLPYDVGAVNRAKKVCIRGHRLEGDNLYVNPTRGGRRCRTCHNEQTRRRYQMRLFASRIPSIEVELLP